MDPEQELHELAVQVAKLEVRMSEIERQRDRAVTSTQWLVGMIVLVLANAAVVWAMVATANPHR